MRISAELLAEFKDMAMRVSDMVQSGDVTRVNALLADMDALEQRIHVADKPIGFRAKGDAQGEWQVTSTYADEWRGALCSKLMLLVRGGAYFFFGGGGKDQLGRQLLRSWSLCSSGCVMSSKTWRRLKQAIVASGQHWDCRSAFCGKR